MDVILTRRSIRKYTDETVSDQLVNELLQAAMSAPSAVNQQPWQFVVIRDRVILDAIPKFHPYSQMLKDAGVAILVCGDTRLEKIPGFWVQDCSAATQNILLAANAKGLGAVWLGIYPKEEMVKSVQELLSLPDEVIPLSLIPVVILQKKKRQREDFQKRELDMTLGNRSGNPDLFCTDRKL